MARGRPRKKRRFTRKRSRSRAPTRSRSSKRRKTGGYTGALYAPNPMRGRRFVTLKYSDQFQPAGATARYFYVFRANAIDDPDWSGVGHQPRYHDQFAVMFNQYTVIASKITVRLTRQDSAQSDKLHHVWIKPSNVTNDDTITVNDLFEGAGKYKYRIKPAMQTGTGLNNMTKISYYMRTNTMFNLKRGQATTEKDYSASFGGSPVLTWYWHIGAENGYLAYDYGVQVDIKYYCMLSHPKIPGQS